jgi:hypothetical protein
VADGFKIADGYVEVHGVVDRRSVLLAADMVTRGVSDQMTTGVAFSNLREGGRRMGAVLGEHGGPSAAREVTEGLGQWIDQGAAAGHTKTAGEKLGELLGRSGGSPFVTHILDHINREIDARIGAGGSGGEGGGGRAGQGGTGGEGGDSRSGVGRGGAGGEGGQGSSGRGRAGPAGAAGENAQREGRGIGDRMGTAAVGGFLDAFTGGFRGLGSLVTANPIFGTAAVAIGAGLALLAAPAFAAAFASALIGGAGLGLIGLGAFLLKDDPEVKKAASKLGDTAKSTLKDSAKPLVEPFVNAMAILENLLRDNQGLITEIFTAIAPAIVPLTRAFAGFVEAALPGFLALIKAATPFLMSLEDTLPRFGEHIGRFMEIIAKAGPSATLFFRDFLNLIGILLVWFGHFITTLSSMYEASRTIILMLVDIFMFFYNGIKGYIELVIKVFERWYNLVKGIFFAARKETDGFVDFLKALPGKAWDALKPTPERVKKLFSDAAGWLVRAGEKIIGGLIQGIKNAIPGLDGILGWVTSKIPDWKGPAEKDLQLLQPTGKMIMQGLGRGIQTGATDLRDQLGQVTRSIPGAATPTIRTDMGGITINIYTQVSRWSEVPGEVIAQLDAALSRYRKAYA